VKHKVTLWKDIVFYMIQKSRTDKVTRNMFIKQEERREIGDLKARHFSQETSPGFPHLKE
jgi:hypothetical protein